MKPFKEFLIEQTQPTFTIVMGGAGVGKNYYISNSSRLSKYKLIDVDEIKKTNPNNFVNVMKDELRKAFESRVDVVQPTIGGTIAGNVNKIRLAKQFGYRTEVIFIDSNADRGIQNVAKRAQGGGHFVPDEKVLQTYQRAREAFPFIAREADIHSVVHHQDEIAQFIEQVMRSDNLLLETSQGAIVSSKDFLIMELFDTAKNWGSFPNFKDRRFSTFMNGVAAGAIIEDKLVVFVISQVAVFFIIPINKITSFSSFEELVKFASIAKQKQFSGKSEVNLFTTVFDMLYEYLKLKAPEKVMFDAAYSELNSVYKAAANNRSFQNHLKELGYQARIITTDPVRIEISHDYSKTV